MRCQACDYELWHCTGRTCPECGEGFSLAYFTFEKKTVLFHCPHCDHGVEGEGPSGKPLTSLEQCEVCGLALSYEMFIVRPIVGADVNSAGSLLPIQSQEGNWFTRYFSTVWLVMTKPQIAISRVPVHEPLWEAWKFYLTTMFVAIVCALITSSLLVLFASVNNYSNAEMSRLPALVLIQCILMVFFLGLYLLIWSALTHVLLQITGGSAFTLRRTFQAVLYSGGASIAGIVPCLGSLLSFVWWLVSATNMITRGQRVHGGRAAFATLTAPLLIFVFVCGGYIMLMFSITAPLVARARATAQQQIQQQSSQVEQLEEEVTDQRSE
mgnify:CR=1 FL=1|jgi:hypothetical protein